MSQRRRQSDRTCTFRTSFGSYPRDDNGDSPARVFANNDLYNRRLSNLLGVSGTKDDGAKHHVGEAEEEKETARERKREGGRERKRRLADGREAVFQPVVGGDDPRDTEIPELTNRLMEYVLAVLKQWLVRVNNGIDKRSVILFGFRDFFFFFTENSDHYCEVGFSGNEKREKKHDFAEI